MATIIEFFISQKIKNLVRTWKKIKHILMTTGLKKTQQNQVILLQRKKLVFHFKIIKISRVG